MNVAIIICMLSSLHVELLLKENCLMEALCHLIFLWKIVTILALYWMTVNPWWL